MLVCPGNIVFFLLRVLCMDALDVEVDVDAIACLRV